MEKVSAIVLSAGRGRRMQSDISKQYIEIYNKPIIYYTLKAFQESVVDEIILVTGIDEMEDVKRDIVDKYALDKVVTITAGGKERYDSVINGLECITHNGKVLIHDGARPLIKVQHINNIVDSVIKYSACVAAMPVKETIKIADSKGYVSSTPDRRFVWQIQTPQAFDVGLIKNAYKRMKEADDITITDDAMVVEKYTDVRVKLVKTDYENIKVTTQDDMALLREVLSKYQN